MSDGDRHWRPPSLRERDDLDELLYVVVEEEIDGIIGLVVTAWPEANRSGAPEFDEDADEFEIAVDRGELQERLVERRLPHVTEGPLSSAAEESLRRRRITVGDVFAIRAAVGIPATESGGVQDCEWIDEAIDVTPDAREAAKARMYEALTPRLDPQIAEDLLAERRRPAGPAMAG